VWVWLMKHLVICLVLVLFSYSLAVADFSGPIVSVLDRDTIEVLHNLNGASKWPGHLPTDGLAYSPHTGSWFWKSNFYKVSRDGILDLIRV